MKRFFSLLIILLLVCVWGCATREDLDRFYLTLNQKVSDNADNLSRVKSDFERFKEESSLNFSQIQESVSKNGEFNKAIRKSQADFGENLNNLRSDIQDLRGAVEEMKVSADALKTKTESGNAKDIDIKIKEISTRLGYIETYLEIEKKESVTKDAAETAAISPSEQVDKEEAYSEAYNAFKNGKYGRARAEFQKFLKVFPSSEYSDNAQYWIGECYYLEGAYEKAILEYEKVIKNYPEGNKVPNSILKQAFSFLKIGDQSSAKLLLQRVIKDYPGTTPASIARQRLVDIK
ncbi:MAG: tol-pal system protein YbgF [Deltaproteobacteria bacterium]|nr:tol-pal system protein YbgF [Deltaproteobacteria bacterium]